MNPTPTPHNAQPPQQKTTMVCPDCVKAMAKYTRLEDRMARRGNFGIVPLPTKCKKHRNQLLASPAETATPEVEAELVVGTIILHNGQAAGQMVSADFARRLERERDQARQNAQGFLDRLHNAQHDLKLHQEKLAAVTRERDELQVARNEFVRIELEVRRDRDGLAALVEKMKVALGDLICDADHAGDECNYGGMDESIKAARCIVALTPEQALQRKEGGR